MRLVWIISEGSPGHVSQTLGFVDALQKKIPFTTQTFECRAQLGGTARKLVRAWMGASGKPLPRWALEKWLQIQPLPAPDAKPDLIISSGGKSVFAARSLAVATGAPYVFLGERKPYRSEWFHTVFTPSASETGVHDVSIEMIPTQMTRATAERAAAEWTERPAGPLWAMIIGGASASHHYTSTDWEALADGMNALAQRKNIRWLLSTSRRTTAEVEQQLRARIKPQTLAAAVWWAEKPEKKMAAFLGAAEVICVTQDSVTMVTETVAAGRPVGVLRPAKIEFPPGSFLPGYFENLRNQGRTCPLALTQLADFEPDKIAFRPRLDSSNDELAAKLIARLKWPVHSGASSPTMPARTT